jgi:hypothetical protein
MSNAPASAPNTAGLRRAALASAAVLHAFLLIDAGIGWEQGLGFGRAVWLRDAGSTELVEQGGFRRAVTGAVALGVLHETCRRVLRAKPPHALELVLLGFGAAFMLASTARFAPLVTFYPDPRAASPDGLMRAGFARSALSAGVFAAGALAFAAGFYRRQVRRYRKVG